MLTALIVEDEPLMREYLLFNLSSIHDQWVTAACAKDGVEAMALLNERHFDLVITDIKMPRMTGVELAIYVHNNIADTDIIFLTGYDEFDYARAAVRNGVADYLLKPLQDAELHAILDKLARKRSGGKAGEAAPQQESSDFSSTTSLVEENESSILVQRAREYIQTNYSKPISLNEVASALDVNPAYLSSIFKSERGEPYSKYLLRLRMERASLLLRTHTAAKISDIAYEVGYLSVKHFDSAFKKYYGVTPSIYRNSITKQNPQK